MLPRSLLATAALTLLAAAPASAAPTLSPLQPCYVAAQEEQREFVTIAGVDFSKGVQVDIYVDEILAGTPFTTFDGGLSGSVRAPFVDEGQRMFTLRVTEHENPNQTVSASALVTRLAVEQTPARAATSERVRFRGRGFTDLARPVYAHYVFAGKSHKTVRIGMPTGPCGLFSVKRKQFPFKNSPRVGVWTIQFDQEPTYNPKAEIRVPLTVRVRKTPKVKPRRAPAR